MATGYSLQFKLRLEQAVLTYGYIFRFVVNDTLSLDFISNLNLGKMNFVMSDSQGILSNMQFSELNDKELNQWLDIKVTFNRQNIRCQINNVVKEIPFTFNSYKHTQDSLRYQYSPDVLYYGRTSHFSPGHRYHQRQRTGNQRMADAAPYR